jgi:pterin-4a-carbinolamine dehydratase
MILDEIIEMLQNFKNTPKLTTSEIVDCATATYQCDANDVSENDIKFARHIERMTRER